MLLEDFCQQNKDECSKLKYNKGTFCKFAHLQK